MANLVYYRKEKETFKDAYERKLDVSETDIILPKLARHFKLGKIYLRWTSGCRRPKAFGQSEILLNWDWNNFGVLCHELAHIKHHQKYHKSGHNKKHWRIMKTMISYCQRKNWFEDELKRRLAPKPIKPEPTKQELQEMLIARLEKNCKRYQTKIKLYQNKLKKATKKIGRLKIKVVMGNPNLSPQMCD